MSQRGPRAAALALCAAAVAAVVSDTAGPGGSTRAIETLQNLNSSEILAESLRRQLMEDNYDYTSSGGEEGEEGAGPRAMRGQNSSATVEEQDMAAGAGRGARGNEHSAGTNFSPKIILKEKNKVKNDILESKSEIDEQNSKYKVRGEHFRISEKRRKKGREHMYDLNEDVAKRYQSRYRAKVLHEDDSAAAGRGEQPSAVTYRLLKLRKQHRRSGVPAALVQEESPDGVSIVNLGPGPFPEFRLLGPRRQYMQAPQPLKAVGDEEELPPPPADDTTEADVEARPAAPAPAPSAPHAPLRSNDELLNSLRITETPHEIFVL